MDRPRVRKITSHGDGGSDGASDPRAIAAKNRLAATLLPTYKKEPLSEHQGEWGVPKALVFYQVSPPERVKRAIEIQERYGIKPTLRTIPVELGQAAIQQSVVDNVQNGVQRIHIEFEPVPYGQTKNGTQSKIERARKVAMGIERLVHAAHPEIAMVGTVASDYGEELVLDVPPGSARIHISEIVA